MTSVLSFKDVSVVRGGTPILTIPRWEVAADQRWVVLGPNGAGKTTALQLASARMHPSSGTVTVLDEQLGKVDVFELRSMIGLASNAIGKFIPDSERVVDVVLTAAYSVTGRWNERYEELDLRRAQRILAEWQLTSLAERKFGTLSDGEKKRTLIARAVMTDPEILLLDEPAASLDLGSREELLALLTGYAASPSAPAIVMVTHHVEEIPVGFTHALLLTSEGVVASGPLAEVMTEGNLSRTFGLQISLTEAQGRYSATATR